MAGLKMRIRGIRETEIRLLSLGDKVFNRHLRKALKAGARPIVNTSRDLLRDREKEENTGTLKRSLGSVSRSNRRRQTAMVVVGPRRGYSYVDEKGVRHTPAHYAHLVEFGHGGPRAAPPYPFMRPAFDETKSAVKTAIINKLKRGVIEEASKR